MTPARLAAARTQLADIAADKRLDPPLALLDADGDPAESLIAW